MVSEADFQKEIHDACEEFSAISYKWSELHHWDMYISYLMNEFIMT